MRTSIKASLAVVCLPFLTITPPAPVLPASGVAALIGAAALAILPQSPAKAAPTEFENTLAELQVNVEKLNKAKQTLEHIEIERKQYDEEAQQFNNNPCHYTYNQQIECDWYFKKRAALAARQADILRQFQRLYADGMLVKTRIEVLKAKLRTLTAQRDHVPPPKVPEAELTKTDLAKNLVKSLDVAARTPHCVGSLSCNFFVARVGELQNVPYFRDVMYPGKRPNQIGGTDSERVANKIYSFIENAVKSPGSGWKSVTPEQAQDFANQGSFVIGVAQSKDPNKHGHIVVAVPEGIARKAGAEGSGPWVRDSQNPDESVRGSSQFGSAVVPPMWAVWSN